MPVPARKNAGCQMIVSKPQCVQSDTGSSTGLHGHRASFDGLRMRGFVSCTKSNGVKAPFMLSLPAYADASAGQLAVLSAVALPAWLREAEASLRRRQGECGDRSTQGRRPKPA